jgi:hypothetical protein
LNKNPKFDPFRRSRPTLTGGNPLTRFYDLNGNIGGPIIRNRLWFGIRVNLCRLAQSSTRRQRTP